VQGPSLSLSLYCIRDLRAVADLVGDLSNAVEAGTAERIASSFLAEFEAEFSMI
jgi:hypothetical protein